MDASDLARFAQRDWSALAELKADYWASMKAREGAGEGLLIADELRRHAQRLHPDWPSDEDRQEDLEDVGGILRQTGTRFESERVRSLLGSLEAALDRSDLRILFEDQVRAAGERKR